MANKDEVVPSSRGGRVDVIELSSYSSCSGMEWVMLEAEIASEESK